jgi:hypothetical protein
VNVLRQESEETTKNVMQQVAPKIQDAGDISDRTTSDDEIGESDSEYEAENDDDSDLVFMDLDEQSQEQSEELLPESDRLIVTTRSGRIAGSWKLAFTE